MKEFCSITFSDKHNNSNRNYHFSSSAGSAHSQVLCAVHDKKWMKFKFDEVVNIDRHLGF